VRECLRLEDPTFRDSSVVRNMRRATLHNGRSVEVVVVVVVVVKERKDSIV
jgi:hypothetical protein